MLFPQFLEEALTKRRAQQRYRARRIMHGAQGVEVSLDDGRAAINFCSNDYLGLANDSALREALVATQHDCGVGSGASHLVCGHSTEHQALEEELAAFCGRERALIFSTGYMANLGIIQALIGRDDEIFEDKLNHASLLDAALLSRAIRSRYRHVDMTHLEQRLARSTARLKLIVSDGIFSMDGDAAPLNALADLAEAYGAWLMVDDAHGFGSEGLHGAGLQQHFGLDQARLPVLVGTLSKAFGCFGAFVAGSEALIEYLLQFARPYIYTTAMPPALAAAAREALRCVVRDNWRRERLHANITLFRELATEHNLPLMPSRSAIQPLIIGDDASALRYSQRLFDAGFWVSAIRPPTVPEGTARLRITLSANHRAEQVRALVEACVSIRAESAS